MKKTITKIVALCFTIAIMVGVVTPKTVQAEELTDNARIAYNMPSGFIPYIYTYNEYNSPLDKLTGGATEISYRTRTIYMYISTNKTTIDEANSSVTVRDIPYEITWSDSSGYRVAKIEVPQGVGKRAVVKADFAYRGKFGMKARKIATGTNEAKLEPLLNATPTTYQLSNADGSIAMNGSVNTFSAFDNFVHWDTTGASANYVNETNNTVIWNLPDGIYTMKETYAGEGMETDLGRSSTFPYFNASNIKKDEQGLYYYTFEVSNQNIQDFLFSNTSNTNFFGFYTLAAPEKFSLTFDNNGGSGMMDVITDKKVGDAITLPNNTFEKVNYDFIGWNTVANPTVENPGFPYENESNFTFGQENEILYAQWSKQKAIHHDVYVSDKLIEETVALDEFTKTLYKTNDLAYNSSTLDEMAKAYITDQKYPNAEYKGFIIEVKSQNSNTWTTYVDGMELSDETQVRYTLSIQAKAIDPILPPVDPGQPDVPVTPIDPIIPVIPPVNPGQPDVPVTPSNPIPPVTPVNPITPVTPAPYTPITPTAPDVTPTETVTPNETPLIDGETEVVNVKETPKAKNTNGLGGSWALINLIATALTFLMALIALIAKRNKEEEEQKADRNQNIAYKRRGWLKVITTIVAIASIILFALTEDMTLPMEYIDAYTIWMIVIAMIQFMMVIVAQKWKETETKTVQVNK